MNADPEVMAFFPSTLSHEASDRSIDAWQAQFSGRGWSNWAVELRDTGESVGFVGLSVPVRQLPFSPCVEIGWRLSRAHWGNGYATEGALGVLRMGFAEIGLDEIRQPCSRSPAAVIKTAAKLIKLLVLVVT